MQKKEVELQSGYPNEAVGVDDAEESGSNGPILLPRLANRARYQLLCLGALRILTVVMEHQAIQRQLGAALCYVRARRP